MPVFVAVLRLEGITALITLDNILHATACLVYVEQVLAPDLSPGGIVMSGNLPAHKPVAARHTIERTGARRDPSTI